MRMSFIFLAVAFWGSAFYQTAYAGEKNSSRTARFAIVVGVNESESEEISPLRYADDDAVAMHRVFKESGVESVLLTALDEDSKSVYTKMKVDGEPTLSSMMDTFNAFSQKIEFANAQGLRTEFLFFYSGHGNVEHGKGYVVLKNGKLTRKALYEEILARSPAKSNHVIIDACRSYLLIHDKGRGGKRSPYVEAFAKPIWDGLSNTGIVLSDSRGADSHEWERYQGGIFSHEVLSALRGGADADLNGEITYAELGAFLSTANGNITNARYRPEFTVKPPGYPYGDIAHPILSWNDSESILTMDGKTVGHVYVEDAAGTRILDAHPSENQSLTLHLPTQRPLFVRKADESGEYTISDRETKTLSNLSLKPVELARKGARHLAFEKLFSLPFEITKVKSFAGAYRADKELELVEYRRTSKLKLFVTNTIAAAAISSTLACGSITLGYWVRKEPSPTGYDGNAYAYNTEKKRLENAIYVTGIIAATTWTVWAALRFWPNKTTASIAAAPLVSPGMIGIGLKGDSPF